MMFDGQNERLYECFKWFEKWFNKDTYLVWSIESIVDDGNFTNTNDMIDVYLRSWLCLNLVICSIDPLFLKMVSINRSHCQVIHVAKGMNTEHNTMKLESHRWWKTNSRKNPIVIFDFTKWTENEPRVTPLAGGELVPLKSVRRQHTPYEEGGTTTQKAPVWRKNRL